MEHIQLAYLGLVEKLRQAGPAALGYSGGVDSTFLAAAMGEALGDDALLILADTPLMPRSEVAAARELAKGLGMKLTLLTLDPLADPSVQSNPADRCYHCKHLVFSALRAEANRVGISHLYDGSNRDDLSDYRPGRKATGELGVISPLKDFTKQEIRQMSALLGLPTANKPALACLATRIPTGEPLSLDLLFRIERAEAALTNLGFYGARVRAHGTIARIELPKPLRDQLGATGTLMDEVAQAIKDAGFAFAALDLSGYKMGSMNGGMDGG